MPFRPRLAWLLLAAALTGCAEKNDAPPLPNSPEEVIKQYQLWYDANRYGEAKQLSTPREDERLDEMAGMLQGQDADSTLLQTRFLVIKCDEQENVAFCYCLLEDQYERYQNLFILRRVEGQWLVDSPEADGPPAAEMERAFEELMQDLETGTTGPEINN